MLNRQSKNFEPVLEYLNAQGIDVLNEKKLEPAASVQLYVRMPDHQIRSFTLNYEFLWSFST